MNKLQKILTNLDSNDSSSEPISCLQKFEVVNAVLSKMARGRKSTDAAADDEEPRVVLGKFEAVVGNGSISGRVLQSGSEVWRSRHLDLDVLN